VGWLKIGERAKVIDKDSKFFGLTVVITDKRVEPKPRPYTIYKVVTENGLPPKNFPFKSAEFNAKQLRSTHGVGELETHRRKDYILFTMVKTDTVDADKEQYEYVHVEKLLNKSKNEIAAYVARQDIRHLSENDGELLFFDSPVKYEVLELDRQLDSLNETVTRMYRAEMRKRDDSTEILRKDNTEDSVSDETNAITEEEQKNAKKTEEMTKLSQSVSERLKALVEEKGISQRVLAGELGLTPLTMANYINTLKIDYGRMLKFADYLDVSIDCLVDAPEDIHMDEPKNELLEQLKEKDKLIEELEDKINNLKSAVAHILK